MERERGNTGQTKRRRWRISKAQGTIKWSKERVKDIQFPKKEKLTGINKSRWTVKEIENK
jgi:hypothetical protein